VPPASAADDADAVGPRSKSACSAVTEALQQAVHYLTKAEAAGLGDTVRSCLCSEFSTRPRPHCNRDVWPCLFAGDVRTVQRTETETCTGSSQAGPTAGNSSRTRAATFGTY